VKIVKGSHISSVDAAEIKRILGKIPDGSIGDVLEQLSREDPLIFCNYYRKLRGYPLTYDARKALSDTAIAELRKKYPDDPDDQKSPFKLQLLTTQLRHRPFLIQPLRDKHRHKVYQKARQVGVSELSITETAHFLWANPNKKWIYTFPRDTQLKEFSVTRISEMFNETARTKSMLTAPPATYVRKIGSSYLILRSAWESQLGEGVDADGVTFDEKDRMKEGVELAFIESMKSSPYSLLREVSTPTIPGRGVNKSFMHSDQQNWLVRCMKCTLEQEIEYPDNILQLINIPTGVREIPPNSYDFRCRKTKCRGPLNRMEGRWVPKYTQNKDIRGYFIPQAIAPWISATGMMAERLIKYQGFWQLWTNYVLGLPAMGENILVSEDDFKRACAGHGLLAHRTSDWDCVSVGIDWGNLNWCVVMARNVHNNRPYLIGLYIAQDNDAKELDAAKAIERYIGPFQPDIIIPDAGYGKDRNAYLLRKFGQGRLYACWYNPSTKASRTFQPVWSAPEQARLLVDRTMTLKRTCQALQEAEFGLPDLDLQDMQTFQKHFLNLAPLRVEEGGEIFEEVTSKGDDHFVHACGYAFIGLDHLMKGGAFNYDFL